MGKLFEHGGEEVFAFAKPNLQFPKADVPSGCAAVPVSEFIVGYWAVQGTFDPQKANAVRELKPLSVKVHGETHEFNILVIKNTKRLATGDEIVYLKSSAEEIEPETKRQKVVHPKSKGKGKGRGKR